MQTGVFPEDLKQALVKPLLKKANLDLVDKNCQPVSNLEFVGNITERAVTAQLTHHIAKYKPVQSAYRKGHSTEMALLKVKTNVLRAFDNQEVTCLVLLDLSAAFDKLNDGKTEFIILGTRQQLAKLSDVSIRNGNTTVLPVDYVHNLGFFLNRLLKNSNHVNRLTAGLFNQLRNISRI